MAKDNWTILRDDSLHDRLYKQAMVLVDGELPLHGMRQRPPGFFLRRRLQKGVALLDQVIEINPRNWAALWVAGMTLRRLGDHAGSLDRLARACEFSGGNPDVPREAGLSAMNAGQFDESIRFTTHAMRLAPDDAGLIANLALAHLLNQSPAEASRFAEEAVRMSPEDAINRKILKLAEDVLAGRRRCPTSVWDARAA
jgi:tetratricopeptide (TPR) repeat protein